MSEIKHPRWRTAGVFARKAWERIDLPEQHECGFIDTCRARMGMAGGDLIRYMDWLTAQTAESMLDEMRRRYAH
jgi:hypothetical protein